MTDLRSPFPWFGGKRRVAAEVWAALGDVDNYVEPFAGSLAVLLCRPAGHTRSTETVNDKDAMLANFWRALAADPAEVARHADWPVNEADLHARHAWLVTDGAAHIERIHADPDFHDAKVAGWWVWGINSWIGAGWCSGTGPWTPNADRTALEKRPHLGDAGRGINRQLPHLGDAGRGINRQLPHLGDAGRGINRQLPHLGDAGRRIEQYLSGLADRLRGVRVCCGDWSRVVTDGALSYGSSVGVFLDPPYLGDVRTQDLYAADDHEIAHDVREWCLANGDNPRYRIVLAGYDAEHDHLMPDTWRRHRWSASSGYAGGGDAARGGAANRHKEVLWMSPGCIDVAAPTLFDMETS
jgi:DNA adenine methylase